MAETNNNENSSDGLGSLLVLGLLGYAAYKLFKSGDSDSGDTSYKKRLSSYEIDSIVNQAFRELSDDEIAMSCACLFIPDILGVKKEHYDNMLLSRIKIINHQIETMKKSGYEAFNPQLNEDRINDLLSYIRNDCYQEIKDIKFIAKLKGNLMSFVPGFSLVGKAQNANIDYKVVHAIKKGLIEFFSALYVYGRSIEEAKQSFRHIYVYAFNNSIY